MFLSTLCITITPPTHIHGSVRFYWIRYSSNHVSSSPVPRLPLFFVQFACQYNTRKWKSGQKNRKGMGTLITWMTSGGHKVDVGGRGPHSNRLHHRDPRRSQDCEYSTWTFFAVIPLLCIVKLKNKNVSFSQAWDKAISGLKFCKFSHSIGLFPGLPHFLFFGLRSV